MKSPVIENVRALLLAGNWSHLSVAGYIIFNTVTAPVFSKTSGYVFLHSCLRNVKLYAAEAGFKTVVAS